MVSQMERLSNTKTMEGKKVQGKRPLFIERETD